MSTLEKKGILHKNSSDVVVEPDMTKKLIM